MAKYPAYQKKAPAKIVKTIELGEGRTVEISDGGSFKFKENAADKGTWITMGHMKNVLRFKDAIEPRLEEFERERELAVTAGQVENEVNERAEAGRELVKAGLEQLVRSGDKEVIKALLAKLNVA